MPDADDFDVEYFRNLLKGNGPKEVPTPPAAPSVSSTRKTRKSPAQAAPARPTGTPKVSRKKSRKG
jgi:hypothetical protein